MYSLLFIAALCTPVAASAQQPLPPLLNPHGFILAHHTIIYRHLVDTLVLAGRYTLSLKPGDDVVVQKENSRWLKVVRGNGEGTGFSTDTATYYLPVRALKDAKMFILI